MYFDTSARGDYAKLNALLRVAEGLAGCDGLTTHEAKDVLRARGRRIAAHRIHLLLGRLARRGAPRVYRRPSANVLSTVRR